MRYFFSVLFFVFLYSCKEEKVNLAGNEPVQINDFIAAFKPIQPPFYAADTNIVKLADTITISSKVFTQFVPDSSVANILGNAKKYTIHPVGRIEKEKEIYLLATAQQQKKITFLTIVLTKKNVFLTAKSLFNTQENDGYLHNVSINKEPTFLIGKERIDPETKEFKFTKVGWVYSNDKTFMVVINDTNEDVAKNDLIINPIDTFAIKNEWSGDYIKDKRNFISIRDGKDAKTYLFFVHFEKKEGTCIGELKGDLKMKTTKEGIYNVGGDPCIIDFKFNDRTVALKEQGSCGNRRGINCFFDDKFTRKKAPKQPKNKKKTSTK